MREGFCRVADAADAARGDVVLEFLVPNRCPADAFDLSPDGRTLVVGTMLKEAYGAEIHLVDVATGRRRLVHAEPPGKGQTFLHRVLFDADGERIIYALNGETRLLDPASGRHQVLAAYQQYKDAQFNPFRMRPAWNRDHTRLLVFDHGDRVRVLDREWNTVFETHAEATLFECWDGALSPSGRLLALSRSKGRQYDDSDPMVTEIEVWDLEKGTVRQRIPIPVGQPVNKVGFDPTETLVLACPWYDGGPGAYSLDTTTLAWHFSDPVQPDRWALCYGWDYSPDGTTLAIGRRACTDVVDTATREIDPAFRQSWPETGLTGRTERVRISADGTLVASGGDSGRILIRRL
ncbi:WD40 repeat domain-containing protein [Thermomonospora echinospora]|nr:hypothetical protein [Thermomonospora echinospora]